MGAGMNIRKMKSSSSETAKRIAKAAREYHSALGSKRTTRLKLSGISQAMEQNVAMSSYGIKQGSAEIMKKMKKQHYGRHMGET